MFDLPTIAHYITFEATVPHHADAVITSAPGKIEIERIVQLTIHTRRHIRSEAYPVWLLSGEFLSDIPS